MRSDVRSSEFGVWHRWLRQEGFWREVVTGTIAGVAVAILIYFFGVLLGYFRTPFGLDNTANFLAAFSAGVDIVLLITTIRLRAMVQRLLSGSRFLFVLLLIVLIGYPLYAALDVTRDLLSRH